MTLNLYATVAALKARVGQETTTDDAILDDVMEAVSRQIDLECGRHFYAVRGTRYFTATCADRLLLPLGTDLLAVTSLKTDSSSDRTYATTWATTDYDLEPIDAPEQSPPSPYWQIFTAPNGDYGFPVDLRRGVQIVGTWGHYDVLRTSTATLAEALDTSELGVDVSDGTKFDVGQVIEIDSERMEISAIATNTLTVERAVNGTTAATHSLAAAIRVATFPVVSEACLQQAAMSYRGIHAPLGIQGSPEYGQVIRATGLHPFVVKALQKLKLVHVG